MTPSPRAILNPPPVHRIPVLVAGRGDQLTLRIVAEQADGWHGGFPDSPADMELKVAALRRWCEVVGRVPTNIEWGVGVDSDNLEGFLARDADTYLEMGFTQFTLGFSGPDWPLADARDWCSWRHERNAARRATLPA